MANESDKLAGKNSTRLEKTVLILTAVSVALAVCMISTNISRYNEDRWYVYTGIFVLSFIIMLIWILVFFAVIYQSYILIYFIQFIWVLVALFWLLFISGCISPTKCPESLWMISNPGRQGITNIKVIEFYYHEYHSPQPDKKPKKNQLILENDNWDSHVVEYVPMITFLEFYIPWSTPMGAILFVMSFTLVLVYFVVTLVVLKKYYYELASRANIWNRLQRGSPPCSCSGYNPRLKMP